MAKDAKNNKEVKNKRHFFKDFKAELKKVIWPTPKQIVNSTIAVITIVIIAAAIVFVLDLLFDILNNKGINSIKENIKNKKAIESVVDEYTENEGENEKELINEDNVIVETTPVNSVEENESSVENVQ